MTTTPLSIAGDAERAIAAAVFAAIATRYDGPVSMVHYQCVSSPGDLHVEVRTLTGLRVMIASATLPTPSVVDAPRVPYLVAETLVGLLLADYDRRTLAAIDGLDAVMAETDAERDTRAAAREAAERDAEDADPRIPETVHTLTSTETPEISLEVWRGMFLLAVGLLVLAALLVGLS